MSELDERMKIANEKYRAAVARYENPFSSPTNFIKRIRALFLKRNPPDPAWNFMVEINDHFVVRSKSPKDGVFGYRILTAQLWREEHTDEVSVSVKDWLDYWRMIVDDCMTHDVPLREYNVV